jgi:hypothetical protein
MNPYQPKNMAEIICPRKHPATTKDVLIRMFRSALERGNKGSVQATYAPVAVPAPDMRPKGTAEERAERRRIRKNNEILLEKRMAHPTATENRKNAQRKRKAIDFIKKNDPPPLNDVAVEIITDQQHRKRDKRAPRKAVKSLTKLP